MASTLNPLDLAMELLDPPRDEDHELALACQGKLSTLVRQAWPIVEPATPFVSGWHIDTICEHLEAVSAGQLPRLIINQPPRTMKSLTVNVFWPAWEWASSPWIRWLFATYAADLALRDSTKCRDLIQSLGGREDGTLFQRRGYRGFLDLVGQDWQLTGDQNAKQRYNNTATGFRIATSRKGMGTGEGGDRVVIDDPISAEQARSEPERKAVNAWWDGTMSTRFNNPRATAVVVMQRLHEEDLTGHLLAKESGWHHLCLPARYEPSHPFIYPDRVLTAEQHYPVQNEDGSVGEEVVPGGRELPGDPRTDEGKLLEPVRLSAARLDELAKELGSYGFAGQLRQLPAPAEGGMFKRHWWRHWTDASLPPAWEQLSQSWDMDFGSTTEGTSYVVGQLWGVNGAQRYLLAQIRGRFSFTNTMRALEALTDFEPRATAKLVERKANGAAVIDMLSSRIGGLIPIEPEGGKDVRAAAVEPLVEAGDVFLPAAPFIPCPTGYEPTATGDFVDELAVFPNGSYDDQVDATSQVLNWLHNKRADIKVQTYKPQPAHLTVVHDGDLVLVGEQYADRP
jgi:predicted phage terminase large subunit-like protein